MPPLSLYRRCRLRQVPLLALMMCSPPSFRVLVIILIKDPLLPMTAQFGVPLSGQTEKAIIRPTTGGNRAIRL